MGKASRTKRERREGGDDEVRRLAQAPAGSQRRQLPVFWIVVALLIVGGLVAAVLTQPDDEESAAVDAVADVPTYAEVRVDGDALAKFPGNDATDPAVGASLPTVRGTRTDGMKGVFAGTDGAQVIAVVAHWCPHCQAEVPRIRDWAAKHLPEDVEIRTISTAASEGQPNFPPAEWLAREKWEFATIVDDEADTAADALGTRGYPFLVFVNADGTVASRYSGEMPVSEFAERVENLERDVAAAA